jgi:TnpA family transposase
MNAGFAPVISRGVSALEWDRIAHVDHTYLCAGNYTAANAFLMAAQACVPLTADWGGGHVAAGDGMRFVVAVQSAYARPSRKYFGRWRCVTWLNM